MTIQIFTISYTMFYGIIVVGISGIGLGAFYLLKRKNKQNKC